MSFLIAKIADDSDFVKLKYMVDHHDDWALEYDKYGVKVWTKTVADINFNMVKVSSTFSTVESIDLYNVIHDPDYRKEWDHHMIVGLDIGHLNPNNDVSYYAMSCPPPLRNRDFVLQRSWLDTGNEHYIINHSVYHKDYPPKKNFVRAISYFTGYFIRQLQLPRKGCEMSYVTSCDPQGILPSWLVNKCTQIFAPKYIKQLEKAAQGYNKWKEKNNPDFKPWIYPEQISSPKILLEDCVPCEAESKSEQFIKREKSLSIALDTYKDSKEQYFENKMALDASLREVSKYEPSAHKSSKANPVLEVQKPEGTNGGQTEHGLETSGTPIRPRSSRLFSWLDFTKTCRRRTENGS